MRASRAAVGLIATFAVAACYPVTVRTDYDPGASFAELQTYEWVDSNEGSGGGPAVDNPLVGKRVRSAVDHALAQRGFRQVSGENADFNLSYRIVAVETIEQRGTYGSYYPYGGFYNRGFFGRRRFFGRRGFYRGGFYYSPFAYSGFGPSYYSTRERLKSTLILDITDASTGELVWRGWAEKNLDENPEPDEVQKYVEEAVEKMLVQFPPVDFNTYVDR